jgi:predicted MFS family arabinose efflux permease
MDRKRVASAEADGARVAARMSWTFDAAVATALLFLTTCAVNLEMPLYRTYAVAAGYGNAVTTAVFAAYVAGLVPTLLFFGGLSDRLGRKPVMFLGLLSSIAATVAMIVAPSIEVLFVARLLQGLGVGLSVGAGTAYVSEALDPKRAPRIVTIATSLGFGGGALFTGTVLLFGATERPVSYWVVAIAGGVCLALVPRLAERPPGGGSPMRLPHFEGSTLVAGASIAVAWAVTGVVISLIPAQLARYGLSAWAGHALFLVNGTGAALQGRARRMPAVQSLRLGLLLLPLGYGILLVGAWHGALSLVLVGAALAGASCYGFTYLGGLAVVNEVGPKLRARAVSGYFLCAYVGFGLPSVVLGVVADRVGLPPTLAGFGVLVAVVCSALALWLQRREATAAVAAVRPRPS